MLSSKFILSYITYSAFPPINLKNKYVMLSNYIPKKKKKHIWISEVAVCYRNSITMSEKWILKTTTCETHM